MPTVHMPLPRAIGLSGPLVGVDAPQILMVKLSSLGDVVHAMPAVQDIRGAYPNASIDWVVEKSFAPIVRAVQGINRVIPCELRKWRKSVTAPQTRMEWASFRAALDGSDAFGGYDAVIDAQGLTKSALVASLAARSQNGKRYALGNCTDGSSWERPTRWLSDVAVMLPKRIDAITRTRELCARALGYSIDDLPASYGLLKPAQRTRSSIKQVALIHGTSRDDKLWPESSWVELALKFRAQGYRIMLPHGSDVEMARAKRLSAMIMAADKRGAHNTVQVWPRMPLHILAEALAGCWGAIGVDSGLSHIATALDVPHVQLYNFDTAWRTGPPNLVELDSNNRGASGVSVVGVGAKPDSNPVAPTVDAVWQAWLRVAQ